MAPGDGEVVSAGIDGQVTPPGGMAPTDNYPVEDEVEMRKLRRRRTPRRQRSKPTRGR